MNLPGGGQKINLLKQKLNEMMKSEKAEKIILFTDRFVLTEIYKTDFILRVNLTIFFSFKL